MKIGIEFDGVIANTPKLKSELAKKFYHRSIPAGMFNRELVVGSKLLSPEQYENIENNVSYSKDTGLMIEEVEDSIKFIQKLLENGKEIKVFTDRGKDGVEIIKEWLNSKGLNLEVETGRDMEKLDIYISDNLERLKSLIGSVRSLFLFTWDYNKHLDTGYSVWRILSWNKLYEHIEFIKIRHEK